MIVEFIGSTGTGKTTLIIEVQGRLAETANVTTYFDLVAAPLGLRGVTHPTAKNLIQDIVGLPFFLLSFSQHREFVIFAFKMIVRHSLNRFFTLNYLRSIIRKVGMYEIVKRYKGDRIILMDEGTIQSAHLLFVYTHSVYSQEELDSFASLVPLPELVVSINVPVDNLVQRSIERADVRKEIKSKNQELVEKYIDRAVKMFEQLAETKEIRTRILKIANPESTDKERGILVDKIANFILNHESMDNKISSFATR